MSFHLKNLQKKKEVCPFSTYVPAKHVIDELKKGDRVKLAFVSNSANDESCSEDMWVVITERRWNNFAGILVDQPNKIEGLVMGQKVSFGTEHIGETEYFDLDSIAWTFNNYKKVTVSKDVLKRKEFNLMARNKPLSKWECGWVFLSGYETQDYLRDKGNFEKVIHGVVLDIDDTIFRLMDTPPFSAYIRVFDGSFYPMDFADLVLD